MSDSQMLKIHGVPDDLRAHLNRDAEQRDVSVNDAVVGVLSARFNKTFVPKGGAFTRGVETSMLNLRLPVALHRAVKKHAAVKGRPMRAVILAELAAHYGLTLGVGGRRPRRMTL